MTVSQHLLALGWIRFSTSKIKSRASPMDRSDGFTFKLSAPKWNCFPTDLHWPDIRHGVICALTLWLLRWTNQNSNLRT